MHEVIWVYARVSETRRITGGRHIPEVSIRVSIACIGRGGLLGTTVLREMHPYRRSLLVIICSHVVGLRIKSHVPYLLLTNLTMLSFYTIV